MKRLGPFARSRPEEISLWVIILGSGLVLLPEPLYTSSLPQMAKFFHATAYEVQQTLTAYLVGLSGGLLIWGPLSDGIGRKPIFLMGILIFIAASWGCFSASNITSLVVMRGIQGWGASVGSVISQAMARDVYTGPTLRKVYALWATGLALFPAISPLLGGMVASFLGWKYVFIVLIFFGIIMFLCVARYLPETLN